MAELNDGGKNGGEQEAGGETAKQAAQAVKGAGKAAAGALKGLATGGPAGAVAGAVKSGGAKYCIIGCAIGCLSPIIIIVGIIGFIGSLIAGWFFGTPVSDIPDEDPGEVYSAYAEKVGEALMEMYGENIESINDYVKKFPDSSTRTETIDGVKYEYTTETVVGSVTINDSNIIDGTERETESSIQYDVDLTDETTLVIAAYSITQPYNATTTKDAVDIGKKIGNKLKSVQAFPMDDPIETMGIEEEISRETIYKQTVDEEGTPVWELDEDGNKIVDHIEVSVQIPWDLEFTIHEFDEDEVFKVFDIDPDARYIDLIEDTTGDDGGSGTVVYTFDSFLKLSPNASPEGTQEVEYKDDDVYADEDEDAKEERRQKWLNSIIGPFMYVSMRDDNPSFQSDGGVVYPDDEKENKVNYDILVYNNTDDPAVAVVKLQLDENSLDYVGDTWSSSSLGREAPASDPSYDEETGTVTWIFDIKGHYSKYVGVQCTANENAYKDALIEANAEVTLYEASVDDDGKVRKDEDTGKYIVRDVIYKKETNTTRVSTPITDKTVLTNKAGEDKGIMSNREFIDLQHESIISELWNVDDPVENMEDQIYTVVINGASDAAIGEFGSGAFSSISGYIWPLENYGTEKISSEFGWRWLDTNNDGIKEHDYHPGIDIAAPEGTPILCTKDGTVEDVGFTDARGYYVVIKHDENYYTLYQHMRDPSGLTKGESVSQKQVVGYVGQTGASQGAHLHFEFIDSSLGDRYYVNEKEGEESRPLCRDPMELYTSHSATSGAVSVGSESELKKKQQEVLAVAQSFEGISPYIHGGHGDSIASLEQSRDELTDWVAGNYGLSNVPVFGWKTTTVWQQMHDWLANLGYELPYVFDCSGLTGFAYGQIGISIPYSVARTSDNTGQWYCGDDVGLNVDGDWNVERDKLEPGDLIFTRSNTTDQIPGHVIMYMGKGDDGKGVYINTHGNGEYVSRGSVYNDYWKRSRVVGARRIITD